MIARRVCAEFPTTNTAKYAGRTRWKSGSKTAYGVVGAIGASVLIVFPSIKPTVYKNINKTQGLTFIAIGVLKKWHLGLV